MLAASAIVFGLGLGLAVGGSLTALRNVRIRGGAGIAVLFLGQAVVRSRFSAFGSRAISIWISCALLLLILVVLNHEIVGMSIAGVGVAANTLVILLNRSMPVVSPTEQLSKEFEAALAASSGFYQLANQRTALPFLGDVLPAGNGMASLGDVLLVIGVAVLIINAMCEQH
ncbi:MAG: DUF5317 family protein [Coriobacteriia bacterium]|nr:DUF5317 family protein [Coriobacteriia bacterium]